MKEIANFDTICRFISKTIHDGMKEKYEVVCDLTNGVISTDLE